MNRPVYTGSATQILKHAALYKKQVLVFVHGYNTDFGESLKRASQIAFDLSFDGALMPFSWPSKGTLTGYFYDRKSAAGAQEHLVAMLDMMAKKMPDTKIHFISHSMGNVVLLGALERIALRRKKTSKAGGKNAAIRHNFGEVLLAHPDVTAKRFAQYAKAVKPLVSGLTLYINTNDIALKLSGLFRKRAGGKLLVIPGIDTIDTTGMGTGKGAKGWWNSLKKGFNHDVFVRNPILFGEITRLLLSGKRPVHERSLDFVPVKMKQGTYWKFKKLDLVGGP